MRLLVANNGWEGLDPGVSGAPVTCPSYHEDVSLTPSKRGGRRIKLVLRVSIFLTQLSSREKKKKKPEGGKRKKLKRDTPEAEGLPLAWM